MKNLNELQSKSIQTLLSEAKNIVGKEGRLLDEEREALYQILDRANFIIGRHDSIYETFAGIFTKMGELDFSHRLPYYEEGDNILNFMVNGINILNDEFQFKNGICHKEIVHEVISALQITDKIIAVTDATGCIKIINCTIPYLSNLNERSLFEQSIHVLFEDFSVIERGIKGEGTIKNISATLSWKGNTYPMKVDVIICNKLGEVKNIIYIIRP